MPTRPAICTGPNRRLVRRCRIRLSTFGLVWFGLSRGLSPLQMREPANTYNMMSLEQAQARKIDHVCRKIRLARGETYVDIGCGFGGFMLRAWETLAKQSAASVPFLHPGFVLAAARWLTPDAPPVVLSSTHEAALLYVPFDVLQQHAWQKRSGDHSLS